MCSLHKASKGRVKPVEELDAVYSLKLKQQQKKVPRHFKLPTFGGKKPNENSVWPNNETVFY